ncbi:MULTISPECIES: hypothetical protein [Hyphobacterium]|uniref:Uncharacterized protein n=1 Tax=Hyphobacterium vulgare TaxID=1736751 RepID=A0ABV6ZZA2_9PROT
MIEILTALTLLAAGDGAAADRLENGRYAALGADGVPLCNDDNADHFDLHALDAPPHARSPNLGTFGFRIGDEAGDYILHTPPRLAALSGDGMRRARLQGGQVHTAGVEIGGVTSGQTIGTFTAAIAVDADGRVWIEVMGFEAERWGREAVVHVAEGEAAGPFGYCGG